MTATPSTVRVLEAAREEGFDLAGVAPAAPPERAEAFRAWLRRGFHAGMDWLERDADRIADPARFQPAARSLLVVGLAHARGPVELEGGGRVARYAAGRDYHNLVGRLLQKLRRRLEGLGLTPLRGVVDAGPVLERSHAARAGLGFESKAANLLHPDTGPWFFLGELFLEDELAPTPSPPAGSCGTCTACIDACPTAAIVEPGVVDAGRCISYHTIENRGPVPFDLRPAVGTWAFGCDVCSEVCPWGDSAGDRSQRFGTHEQVGGASLVDWLRTPAERFGESFRGSPLQRARREGLARNAAIVLGNAPSEEGRAALTGALENDPAPLVRAAAGWGLARGHGVDAGSREAVERARRRETDPDAREDLGRSLEALGGTR